MAIAIAGITLFVVLALAAHSVSAIFCIFIWLLWIAKECDIFVLFDSWSLLLLWRYNHIERTKYKILISIFHSIKTSILYLFLFFFPNIKSIRHSRAAQLVLHVWRRKIANKKKCLLLCCCISVCVCVRFTNRSLWSFSIRSTVEMPPRVASSFFNGLANLYYAIVLDRHRRRLERPEPVLFALICSREHFPSVSLTPVLSLCSFANDAN